MEVDDDVGEIGDVVGDGDAEPVGRELAAVDRSIVLQVDQFVEQRRERQADIAVVKKKRDRRCRSQKCYQEDVCC